MRPAIARRYRGIERRKGDNSGLPEISPPVDKLAATMIKLAESRGVPDSFHNPRVRQGLYDLFRQVFQVFLVFQVTQKAKTLVTE